MWKKSKVTLTKSKFTSSPVTSCKCLGENNPVLPSDSTILFSGSSLIRMSDFFYAIGSRNLKGNCFYLKGCGIGCKTFQRVHPEPFLTSF